MNITAFLLKPFGLEPREIPNTDEQRRELNCLHPGTAAQAPPGSLPGPDEPPYTPAPMPPTYPKADVTRQVQDLSDGREFRWKSDNGGEQPLSVMATPHLHNALRMLFNHSVPPAFRVGTFKRHARVASWNVLYRAQAAFEIKKELDARELEPWMEDELSDIVANASWLRDQDYLSRVLTSRDDVRAKVDDYFSRADVSARLSTLGVGDNVPHVAPPPTPDYVVTAPPTPPYVTAGYEVPTTTKIGGIYSGDRAAAQARLRRAIQREKRMRRAAKTAAIGFPGKRCMQHRSYAGIRSPRLDCTACKQVYRARQRSRRLAARHCPK